MLKYLFLLMPFYCSAQITSYTSTQTGVGNAEVYWPTGATHVVVFIPGKGEMGTNKELLYKYNSPINWIRSGERPTYAVIAIQPTAYNSSTYLAVTKFVNWIYKTFPAKTYSATGLSYGAAAWYDYIKKATDYKAPYSAVLLSITSEAQCDNYSRLCGTDTRFKEIRLWAMDGAQDSHHNKQMAYTKLMIAAGYPARWTSIPNTGHCCWDVQYSNKEVKEWLAGPVVTTDPSLSINAGADTTIYFPQDSFIIRATGVPEGADVRASVIEGFALVDGMLIKNIYKGSVTVRVYVFLNGKQAYDDITITAIYDKDRPFYTFYVGGQKMAMMLDGRIIPVAE